MNRARIWILSAADSRGILSTVKQSKQKSTGVHCVVLRVCVCVLCARLVVGWLSECVVFTFCNKCPYMIFVVINFNLWF